MQQSQAPVRSLHPAHEPIVSVEEFTEVQVVRAAKSVGGKKGQAKQERNRRGAAHYALRGMVYCGSCGRKMQASRYNAKNDDPTHPLFVNYRCRARDLVEGSAALADHPANVSVRQIDLLAELMSWLAAEFASENRDLLLDHMMGRTVDRPNKTDARQVAVEKKLAEVEKGLSNLVDSIEKGVDPALLAPRMQALGEEKTALRNVAGSQHV